MTVALIYPPSCDPTAPYLAVPLLTGVLRSRGVSVLPVDANVEAYDRLLQETPLANLARRIRKRWARLTRKPVLGHVDQLLYLRLARVLPDLDWVPAGIADAVAVLRDPSGRRFYDPVQYERTIATITAALQLISAAYSPLEMDFTAYRTPFALLSENQIRTDAQPANNPFYDYFNGALIERLAAAGVSVAGISLAFPGQIQPGFALAQAIKTHLPAVHVTVGGPAATQLMCRFDDDNLAAMRGSFDSVVLFEGEVALTELVETVAAGRTPPPVIRGSQNTDLAGLAAPDFGGLPMEKYFAPELVLPYDPTRGCYWGRCAFCHYGLSHRGTATYRQRPVPEVVAHLRQLSNRWNCRTFYFSQDAFAPAFARRVATALRADGTDILWGSDMRPESSLTLDCCRELKDGGALSVALGIESAAPRLIRLIDKGVTVAEMESAAVNLAEAGIAVEAMCFTDFPTESRREAMATLGWLKRLREKVALFVCGRFGLSHGSRVASDPGAYGIDAVWRLDGDLWQTGLFYHERRNSKAEAEREAVDGAVDGLSSAWWLHDYPWAGALSTAHTLLYYVHGGPDVFRRLAGTPRGIRRPAPRTTSMHTADLNRMTATTLANEADIWHHLIHDRRAVSPALYDRYAATLPVFRPRMNTGPAGVRHRQRRP